MTDVRFVTMADADHAVGVVALVNSLRIQGHTERVTVLDLGLTPHQRDVLAPECDIVARPGEPGHAWLLVPTACLAALDDGDPGVVVYLDCDQIVTGSLSRLIAEARAGRVCAIVDHFHDRWFAEWATLCSLDAQLRREPYLNAGFVVLDGAVHGAFLQRWAARCAEIDSATIAVVDMEFTAPLALPDQDVFNAMVMSELPATATVRWTASRSAQGVDELRATRVLDRAHLRCERAGEPLVLLHSFGLPKPWQPAAARDLHATAYLRLLRRLLTAPDVALRIDDLVPWLQPGWRGALTLRRLTLSDQVRSSTRRARQRVGLVRRSSAPRRPSP